MKAQKHKSESSNEQVDASADLSKPSTKFLTPPIEIIGSQHHSKAIDDASQKDGFEFLNIGLKEASLASNHTKSLFEEKLSGLSGSKISTLSMPAATLLVDPHSNEKAQGKVGTIKVYKSGRIVATICGNDYDVLAHESATAEEIVSLISGEDFGNDFDEGVHIGSVNSNFRLIPKIPGLD